ncbi:MAG: DUF2092 domain-containing protein, partial [Caldilineae bacterium]
MARLQQAQQPQNLHTITDMVVTLPDGSQQHSVVEEWRQGSDRQRLEYRPGSDQIPGMVMVRNGATMWTYNPADNTYTEQTLPPFADAPLGAADSLRRSVQELLRTTQVTYTPAETIAGRPTYRIHLEPKADQPSPFPGPITVWVDAETYLPLKMESGDDQSGGKTVMTVQSVDYNPTFPEGIFTFTPPPGATRQEQPLVKLLSLEEARAQADFPLLAPTKLPEGYEFAGAQLIDTGEPSTKGGKMAMLMYRGGVGVLMIAERPLKDSMEGGPLPTPEGQTTSIEVRGHPGVLSQMGLAGRMLVWEENGVEIRIVGQLSQEELLALA